MCSHQQDLGYKGFIANIIICEKTFCPVTVFPAPPIVWCVKTARSNTGEQLIWIYPTLDYMIRSLRYSISVLRWYVLRLFYRKSNKSCEGWRASPWKQPSPRKHFSVPTDRLAFNEFAFLHDSIWLLLFPEDNDDSSCDNSRDHQWQQKPTHTNELRFVDVKIRRITWFSPFVEYPSKR